jgi:glycosyltransferase involved in cell wall biosynthesis
VALAAALVRLLKDPELRARFGEAGRRRVAEAFSVGKLVTGTASVYDERLRRRRPAAPASP